MLKFSIFLHTELGVTKRMSNEFSLLRGRFGSMMIKARQHLEKHCDIHKLKEHLRYCYYREEINHDRLSDCNSIKDIFEGFILPQCSVSNCSMLISLATELHIHEIIEAVDKFEQSEEKFKTCLRNEELGTVVNEETTRHQSNSELPKTEIKLKVDWKWPEATLTDFRSLVHEVFPGLHRWIHLEVVNSGCVCFTCSAPARLEGVLIQMGKQRQKEAMKMRVILLQVGETVIFEITKNQVKYIILTVYHYFLECAYVNNLVLLH